MGIKRRNADIGTCQDGGHGGIGLGASKDDIGVAASELGDLGKFWSMSHKQKAGIDTLLEEEQSSLYPMGDAVPGAKRAHKYHGGLVIGGALGWAGGKAVDIGTPGSLVDARAVDFAGDSGLQGSHDGIGPAALERRPAPHRSAEAVVDLAFADTGGIDNQGIDLEQRRAFAKAGGNHAGSGKIVIALHDDIGLQAVGEGHDGRGGEERQRFGDVDVIDGESVELLLGRRKQMPEVGMPFATDRHHMHIVATLTQPTSHFIGMG